MYAARDAGPGGVCIDTFVQTQKLEREEISDLITKTVAVISDTTKQLRDALAQRTSPEYSYYAAAERAAPLPDHVYWTPELLTEQLSAPSYRNLSALVTAPEDRHALTLAQDSLARVIKKFAVNRGRGLQLPVQHTLHRIEALDTALHSIFETVPEAPVPPWARHFAAIADTFHTIGRYVDPEESLRQHNATVHDLTEKVRGLGASLDTCTNTEDAVDTCDEIVRECQDAVQYCSQHMQNLEETEKKLDEADAFLAAKRDAFDVEAERLGRFLELACSETINTDTLRDEVTKSREVCGDRIERCKEELNGVHVELQRIDTKQKSALTRIIEAINDLRRLQNARYARLKRVEDLNVEIVREKERLRQFENCVDDVAEWARITDMHSATYRSVVAQAKEAADSAVESAQSHVAYVRNTLHYGSLRACQQTYSFLVDQYVALGHVLVLRKELGAEAAALSTKSWQMRFLCGHRQGAANEAVDEIETSRSAVRKGAGELWEVLTENQLSGHSLDEADHSATAQHTRAKILDLHRSEQQARRRTKAAVVYPVDERREGDLIHDLARRKRLELQQSTPR